MSKPCHILACDAKFQFPFGVVEVSEEFLCSDASAIDVPRFTERLSRMLSHCIPTAVHVSSACAFLPEGIKPSGGCFSFDALIRNFICDLSSILANLLSSYGITNRSQSGASV